MIISLLTPPLRRMKLLRKLYQSLQLLTSHYFEGEFTLAMLKTRKEVIVQLWNSLYMVRHNSKFACIIYYIILFLARPYVSTTEMEMIVEVGSNVTLNCSAIAFPEPDITWTLDANMLLFGRDKLETLQSSSIQSFSFLTLESVALEDNGIYNCFANNSFGSGDVSVALAVLGKGVYIKGNS